MKKINILLIVIILLLALVGGAFYYYNAIAVKAVDPGDDTPIAFSVEEGSSTRDIGASLKEADLIRSSLVFRLRSKQQHYDGKYLAGDYQFSRAMDMDEIMAQLLAGGAGGKSFTVVEGQSLNKIAAQLAAEGVVSEEDFFREVEEGQFDYDFMSLLPEGAARLEGFLGPNSYNLPEEADAHMVIDTMLRDFDDRMQQEGLYDAVNTSGQDLYTVITKASIVEREASVKEEMGKVASVIDNRLAIDMPLQMDGIIAYLRQEDKIRFSYDDIDEIEGAYNPYTDTGLPPTPICIPSMDAIRAVLSPEDTDYLYFVASPELDGTHRYSVTYEEFLVDKAAFDEAYEQYIEEHPGEE